MAPTTKPKSGGKSASKSSSNGSSSKPRDLLADQRDDDGNLIDPPTLPEYEQRLNAATLAADTDEIQSVQEEYAKAREERATVLAKRAQEKKS